MTGDNFYLVGSMLYFEGGPSGSNGGQNIATISLSTLNTYLDATHVPTDSLGWGPACRRRPRQLLRPGHHP